MRFVPFPALQRDVSALAFGSASLGSRVAPRDGERAVHRALDAGVTWFDVAPPYGDGHAEELLGAALGSRRADVVLCTKFGISRPNLSFGARVVRPLARRVVGLLPGLRTVVSRSRGTGARSGVAPADIEGWLDESLRRLKTDYVDVFAMHEPSPAGAADAESHGVLRDLVAKGKIRAVSIAGPVETIAAAASAGRTPEVVQFPDSPFAGAASTVRALPWARQPFLVTHGVFGAGALPRLSALDGSRRQELLAFAQRWGLSGDQIEPDILARFAFANNPDGVVISSMFSAKHMEQNAAIAGIAPEPRFARELLVLLSGRGENA